MANCDGRCADLGLVIDEDECDCSRCQRCVHTFNINIAGIEMECEDCRHRFRWDDFERKLVEC